MTEVHKREGLIYVTVTRQPKLGWLAALLLHIHGAAKPKALVADTGLSHSSLTQMMDRFQLEGWVTREPDPHDKRGTVVTLTAAGRKKFKSIFEP